jgi:hypothetical protein
MINCPNCGTENRDGSKFCNECGHLLGQATGATCVMCGAKNAPENTLCAECGARLTPLDQSAADTSMTPATAVLGDIDEDSDLPDWLLGLREAAKQDDTEQTPAEVLPPGQAPERPEALPIDDRPSLEDDFEIPETGAPADDWLSRLRRAASTEVEEVKGEDEPFAPDPILEEAEQPAARVIPAPFEPVQNDTEDLPDWLSQLRNGLREEAGLETSTTPDETAPQAPGERDTGGLSWLNEVVLGDVVPATSDEEYDTPDAGVDQIVPSARNLPPRAADVAPVFSAESDALPGEPATWHGDDLPPLERATDIPDWLREMGPFAEEPESPDALPGVDADQIAAALPSDQMEPSELPDWLTPAAAGAAEPDEDPAAAGLARAEIPDWLAAMRPDAHVAGPSVFDEEEGDSELEGVLAGLHDVIPIELSMATPPDTTHLGGLLGVLPEDDEGAGRFAQILEQVAPARTVRQKETRRFSLWRVVMALALVVLIAIPMTTDFRIFENVPSAEGAIDLVWTRINDLASGNAVVVAYDFDPSTAGEMEPIADTLIDHLMQREARIIAVSLMPAGPAVAQRSMARMAELHQDPVKGYVYGARYLNLGYLPGKEAGLRSFLANPFGAGRIDYATGNDASTLAGLAGLSSLDDVSLIVVLAAAPESVRWWVEQVGSQIEVPIVAGVSAAVEPQIRPYYQSATPQIEGLVSGLAGAAEYGVLIAGRQVTTGELEALRWATAFVVLVILAGIIISPLTRRAKGSKS